ncbi:carcinoembryonic antigen-related cell adhesion molecule 5-like isoform X2 [Acipenser ruthenus]|uniref:carcinoembryonic antigen-related cell adhesion molecule 5-like isoform X2 n=1 Tax=Acipenser ruthenus TaxID=7906 RepID=UPI002741558C|nr:carcinoembryonic antigen-related cell adhesion molecule 5-like isoform X2 [Acipenser ruthenus]
MQSGDKPNQSAKQRPQGFTLISWLSSTVSSHSCCSFILVILHTLKRHCHCRRSSEERRMEVLLIFTILLLAPQSPVVCADDRIAVSPADATVQIGGSITLICSTTCPNGKPEWKKGLDALPYKPRTSGERSEIEIQDAQTEHEGTYMCMVMCEQKTIRKILALTVFSLPDLTVQCDPKEPVSGQPFSLSCSLHGVYPPGSVQMRWLHGERVIEGPAGAEESADDTFYNYELTTKQQLHATTAEYRCEADLVLPNKLIKTKNQTLPLHFQVVPSMSTSFLRKPLGEPASFTCKADPSFSISWAKLGSQGAWGPPGHWNLSVSAGFSLVHIEALQPGDSGNYSCILNNEATKVALSITIEVSYAPKNTSLTPSEPSVKEGDPLTLTCRGDASPEPQIRWTKLNSTLPDSWSLSTGQGQSTLTAPSLAPEHSGTYQCEISNGVGREALTTTLDVLYAPKNTSLTPSEPSVKEGDPLTLTCMGDASPEPQIRWTKLNSTLPDSWSLSTGQGQSTLTAPSLAPEHSGTYQCEISNVVGREALTTTLDVLYAPKNTSLTPSEPSVKEGDPLTLTCRGDASPEPQIRWTKLNSTLPDSWSLSTGQGQSTLTAPSLAPEHSGTYQCEISNGVGREALTTTLDVLYAPKNTSLTPSEPSVKEGDPLTLTCRWDASPEPQIRWTKLNSTLPDSWSLSTGQGQSTLTAPSLAPEHSGTYQCEISNGVGREALTTTLDVLYAPKNTSLTPSEPSVKEGDPLTLTCRGDASPEPQIRWTKLNSTLPDSWSLSTGQGQSTLTAPSLAPEHSGTYQCEISNGVGREALTTTLDVLYAPKNTSLTPSEPSVKEGDPLTLTCRGDASPEPQIRWTKLNSTLPDSWSLSTGQGQSTLTAPSLAPEHSGTYQCEISNSVGREALTTTLDVLYSPRNIGADSGVITGNEGQPLKINCSWDANPKPDIQWLKLGSEKQDHWEISESGKNSQLRINALGSDDLGVYTCLIRNKMGEIHSNTTVRATGEHGVQIMTITIATALPALVLSLFGALVGWLRKNRQSSLSINP